ncbi:MAG: hypothetical protein PVF73_05095 [Bacteroidales bacterium]|jgi:hypothetical protein
MITYEQIMAEAESYTKLAIGSFEKKKFDNKFILSLATISFEKFMVAYLMARNDMPEGHTLSYLIIEMSKYTRIEKTDIDMLTGLDEKIRLCAIEHVPAFTPADIEMETILNSLIRIKTTVQHEIEAIKTNN